MKVIWQEWTVVPNPRRFGHGVYFHDKKRREDNDLIAFVDGYQWLHENPEEVVVCCIKPDEETTVRTMNAMKKRVELLLLAKKVPHGMITNRVEAIVNG